MSGQHSTNDLEAETKRQQMEEAKYRLLRKVQGQEVLDRLWWRRAQNLLELRASRFRVRSAAHRTESTSGDCASGELFLDLKKGEVFRLFWSN